MRIAILCLSVLVLLGVAAPAKAGDYYGYRNGGYGNVHYSSSCCYKKVVRHATTTRYVRVDEDRSYYRGSGYYDQSYRSSSYYDRPRQYVDDNSYAPRRYVGYDNGGYSSDYSGYSAYGQSCYDRRVRVDDWRGGWVWSTTRVCN